MTIGKIIGLAGRKTVSSTNRLMQNIDTDKDERMASQAQEGWEQRAYGYREMRSVSWVRA